jgi:hypothetical protein
MKRKRWKKREEQARGGKMYISIHNKKNLFKTFFYKSSNGGICKKVGRLSFSMHL